MGTYSLLATSKTPSTIIYLLDISASMGTIRKGIRRIDLAFESLISALDELVSRSTKGRDIQKRYRVAVFAYSEKVYDVLSDAGLEGGGIQTIDQIAKVMNKIRVPQPLGGTNTAAAFDVAKTLLYFQMPFLTDHPAPLVCHLTDGRFDKGRDPSVSIESIKKLKNADGSVLIENIYIPEELEWQQDVDISDWKGISRNSQMPDEFAKELIEWSSRMPKSYRDSMIERGIPISYNAMMMFPGTRPDLVRLGMQIATLTE